MSKIEEAIEDVINEHLSGMDFSDMITSEVRDTWDMDELDRIDELDCLTSATVDRVDALELWVHDAEDKLGIQNVIDLENSIKNLVEHTNQLQMRIKDLEDRLLDYEEIREMAWQSAHKKSFFQKLMFWR